MDKTLTFDENYGRIPKYILVLIKRHNVSPADFDMITDFYGYMTWEHVADHIVSNTVNGIYRMKVMA
jgi:hypothetical protein